MNFTEFPRVTEIINTILIKEVVGGSRTLTLAAGPGQSVEGAPTFSYSRPWACLRLMSDGAGWLVVGSYEGPPPSSARGLPLRGLPLRGRTGGRGEAGEADGNEPATGGGSGSGGALRPRGRRSSSSGAHREEEAIAVLASTGEQVARDGDPTFRLISDGATWIVV
ncbi:hypothetical protein [Sorangium cellulosum]|uniref:hypothetical protein n=1 Tax=Sorangium cellulosum TaxID=56 RepID=UPI0010135321|nr:hypothetical protein [Sorangium cellulosum]